MFNASGKVSIIPIYLNVHLKQFKIYFGKTFGKNGIFFTFTKLEIEYLLILSLSLIFLQSTILSLLSFILSLLPQKILL